jgi:Holliday junction resolvase
MSRESFLRRTFGQPGRTPSHDRSKKQERELAKRVGGEVTIASGAFSVKGDVRKKRIVRIEAKTTKHKSFSVTTEMIDKIEEAALACDELPIIVVELANDDKRTAKQVAVVPLYVLDTLGYSV